MVIKTVKVTDKSAEESNQFLLKTTHNRGLKFAKLSHKESDQFPPKAWLYHFSSKDEKVKRHFWVIDEGLITLYLTEDQSLFYKQIPLSSIITLDKVRDFVGLKIVLSHEKLIVTSKKKIENSNPAIMKRWYGSVNTARRNLKKVKLAVKQTDQNAPIKETKGFFDGFQFVLDLDLTSFNEKKQLRDMITSNGGQISYIITSNSDFLIMNESRLKNKPDSYKYRKAVASGIPVVSEEFVKECVKQGKISKVELANKKAEENFSKGKIEMPEKKVKQKEIKFDLVSAVKYKFDGGDCPEFPHDFQIPKFSILEIKLEKGMKIVTVEAHVAMEINNSDLKNCYRVMTSWKSVGEKVSQLVYPCANAAQLSGCYEALVKSYLDEGLSRISGVSDSHFSDVPSETMNLILSEMKTSSGQIHPEVVRLLETVWMDSTGKLFFENGLGPVDLSVDRIRNALIVLLKIEEAIKDGKFDDTLSQEFYKYINENKKLPIDTIRKVAMKRELCQLLKDIVALNENGWMSKTNSILMHQYSALKCAFIWLDPGSNEFKSVQDLLTGESKGMRYKIRNIFKVNRNAESCEFRSDLPNRKLLFHASSATNFVSIFSKGLVMPYTVTSELGVERRDEGCFGSGIYFSNSFEMSSEFATRSANRGTRLILVNEVALGEIFETSDMRPDLLAPPDGFNSVKGIGNDSRGDEYVIFTTAQQKMRYLIEFTLNDEQVTDRVSETLTMQVPEPFSEDSSSESETSENLDPRIKEVKYGLVVEGEKDCAKLEEIHIRGKVIDLVSEVTLFQSYKSSASKPVEAKYVFPLTDNAAVCGFEAFINEKHVIGEVKEKEEAHREYKKAVAEGHGAYLMDEESPNVFTVSIGNIPPRARVVIKVTYIVELETVDDPESCVLFTLPDSISSWTKDAALLESSATQTTTKSITVNSGSKKSSFILSIDMPFDILDISSQTHKIVSKKTATKACVKLQKSEKLSGKSLQLLIKVAEIHVPRIWIEEDNEAGNGDQVAMVTFFPEFDFQSSEDFDCTILLDMSNSMAGPSSGYAKYISSLLIDKLPGNSRLNVVAFGSTCVEKFVSYERATSDIKNASRKFVTSCKPQMGTSDLVNFLNSVLATTDVSTNHRMQNIFLVSDGYLSDEDRILRIANLICDKSNAQTRVFTMAVGNSPNSHLLQSLSVATGGRYEHFLPSTKSTWKSQVENQVSFSKQPALTDVRLDWSNYENSSNEQKQILHTPDKVKCVFNGSRLTAYSFLPGCTKSTLHARICSNEFSTVVIATSLSKISGRTLHRLAAKAVFKEYESGRLSDNGYVDQVIRDKRKSSIISLSIKFSVVSKFTSFVAIEKRKENEDMSITSGPRVEELVQSAFLDIIPEISWGFEGKSVEENIDDLLKQAAQIENSSIIQARELAVEAKRLFDTLTEPDSCQKLSVYATLCKLDVVSEYDDPFTVLSNLLVHNYSRLNFDEINSISRCSDHKIFKALHELCDSFWPKYCSIQLDTFPEKFWPLVVGGYLQCSKVYLRQSRLGLFSDDRQSMHRYWDEMRRMNFGNEDEVTSEVLRKVSDSCLRIFAELVRMAEKKSMAGRRFQVNEALDSVSENAMVMSDPIMASNGRFICKMLKHPRQHVHSIPKTSRRSDISPNAKLDDGVLHPFKEVTVTNGVMGSRFRFNSAEPHALSTDSGGLFGSAKSSHEQHYSASTGGSGFSFGSVKQQAFGGASRGLIRRANLAGKQDSRSTNLFGRTTDSPDSYLDAGASIQRQEQQYSFQGFSTRGGFRSTKAINPSSLPQAFEVSRTPVQQQCSVDSLDNRRGKGISVSNSGFSMEKRDSDYLVADVCDLAPTLVKRYSNSPTVVTQQVTPVTQLGSSSGYMRASVVRNKSTQDPSNVYFEDSGFSMEKRDSDDLVADECDFATAGMNRYSASPTVVTQQATPVTPLSVSSGYMRASVVSNQSTQDQSDVCFADELSLRNRGAPRKKKSVKTVSMDYIPSLSRPTTQYFMMPDLLSLDATTSPHYSPTSPSITTDEIPKKLQERDRSLLSTTCDAMGDSYYEEEDDDMGFGLYDSEVECDLFPKMPLTHGGGGRGETRSRSSSSRSLPTYSEYTSAKCKLLGRDKFEEELMLILTLLEEKFGFDARFKAEILNDHELSKLSERGIQFLNHIQNLIISAGGKSLGITCFNAAWLMLIIAIIIEFVDHGLVAPEKADLEAWLKSADLANPLLYTRLELGKSWKIAAKSVILALAET